MQARFRRKFNFNPYPQKSQISRWVRKFQATWSVNNHKKKAKNPRPSMKLTARCLDDVDAVRDYVGRRTKKDPSEDVPKSSSFTCTVGWSQSISPPVIWFYLSEVKWLLFFRLRWKITRCIMNYLINGFYLFWDSRYNDKRFAVDTQTDADWDRQSVKRSGQKGLCQRSTKRGSEYRSITMWCKYEYVYPHGVNDSSPSSLYRFLSHADLLTLSWL